MKNLFVSTIASVVLFSFASSNAVAASYVNYQVTLLEPSFSAAPGCYLFQLAGVTQADPAIPGSATFTIPYTQSGAKEMYALLLAAKLSSTPVTTGTTGQAVCGFAAISYVAAL